jgi:hypothetical protein
VVSSSSTRKAARLAQKGKGKKVRFQGGTLFPLVMLGVIVVGLLTIVYARQSVPAVAQPSIDDHWHAAYGFDLCDQEGMQQVTGAKEERDANQQLLSTEYLATGVHSHDDGVIHWHAFGSRSSGRNAKLGVFLDVYGIELDDDSLIFPPDQLGGAEYIEGETKCGDEDGTLAVVVWNNFSDTDNGRIYTAGFDDIRVDRDGMVFVIAFIPDSQDPRDIEMPPWAPDLPSLGAVDQANTGQEDFLPGSSVPGASAPADSTPGTGSSVTEAPGTTAPAEAPPTTTG